MGKENLPYFSLYKGKSIKYSEASYTKPCIDILMTYPDSHDYHIVGQYTLPIDGTVDLVIFMPKMVQKRRERYENSYNKVPKLPDLPPYS